MSVGEKPSSYAELISVLEALPILVREKRRREGLSVRAAAKRLDVTYTTVHRFENGEGAHIDTVVCLLKWVAAPSVSPTEEKRDA